jgi:hypothetical protein
MSNETDFENDVRSVLQTIDTEPPLDPVAVIRQGHRIQNRRRALVGVAAVGVAAAVAVPVTLTSLGTSVVTTATSGSPEPSVSTSPPASSVSYVCPAPGVTRTPPEGARPLVEHWGAGALDAAQPVGDAICTGEFGSKGEAAIFFQHETDVPGKPQTLWEGRRDGAGKYTGYFRGTDYNLTNKSSKDLTPGFHHLTGDGWDNFVMGYYVGPVATVDFTVVGKKMSTHVQKWSGNADVSFVWFRIPVGTDPMHVYDTIYRKPGDVKITVKDANGDTLPLGNAVVAGM